jgi:hypothetical protein
MPEREHITAYHNFVADDVRRILSVRTKFHSPDNWAVAPRGAQLMSELVPADNLHAVMAMKSRQRKPHKVFVFPLNPGVSLAAGAFWASWHEKWRKLDSKEFVLLDAGWTLFEGLVGDQYKTQVLRADWDQLLNEKGSKHAGQPHWHFDDEIFCSAGQANVEVGPGLIEVQGGSAPSNLRAPSVGFIHLAMGTWKSGADHPECWQRDYMDDCQLLRDWCVKTLRYLRDQVQPP